MAIDRQYVMQLVQQIVFALIQNPRAAEQVDILGLLDYWVAMMDVELQLKQFTKTPEQIQQEAQAAAGGVVEGTGVEPATNPQAVTEPIRSEEHTSELQSLMRISYAVFCLKKKTTRRELHQLRR